MIRAWIRANIVGERDFGYARRDGDFGNAIDAPAAIAPPIPDAKAAEEAMIAGIDRIEEVKDMAEQAAKANEPLRLDPGGMATGFGLGVVTRVLAHVLARSIYGKDKA